MTDRSFAEILFAALDEAGISLSQAARELSIHRSTLHRWLSEGVRPRPDQLSALNQYIADLKIPQPDKQRYLTEIAASLGLRGNMLLDDPPPPFPRRLHFGADVLPPFAGRADELALLQEALQAGKSVLITGMGGVGKTRLAQELLRTASDGYAHGCEALMLSPTQSAEQVIRNFAILMGVELDASSLADRGREALEILRARLRGVELLVLLDNVAHVDQVRDLVRELGMIRWVLTSRSLRLRRPEPIHVRLEPPDAAAAVDMLHSHLRYATVTDRADAEAAQLVVERLGRLPLAIALSSAMLTSRQFDSLDGLNGWLNAGGLRNRGVVGQRLRSLFEQMVDGLPLDARQAFRLCGVFPTPYITLDAYQAIGRGAGLACAYADLETLAERSLVDLSTPGRIHLHVLVQEHARERLESSAEAGAVRESFLDHYVDLAWDIKQRRESVERHYFVLQPEADSLLHAAALLHATADWSRLRRLWPVLSGFLWTSGYYRDYEHFDRLCLDGARAVADTEWQAVLLSEIGYVNRASGDLAGAEALYHEAQMLHDTMPDDTIAQARLRRYRSEIALEQGDAPRALALLDEAQALLARRDDDPPPFTLLVARVLLHSAQMTAHAHRSDWEAAAAAGRRAEALYRQVAEIDPTTRYGEFRVELGDILLKLGLADEAAEAWEELLRARGDLPRLPIHHEVEARLAGLRERAAAG